MAYGDFKDLAKKTSADEVLKYKAFNIAKDPKYDGYQRGIASMVYRFFDCKTKGSGIKNGIKQNHQLAEELHKPVIRKCKKRKVHSAFIDNIWGDNPLIRDLDSYYVLLIFLANLLGLFL